MVEGGEVSLICRVYYKGLYAPTMQWVGHGVNFESNLTNSNKAEYVYKVSPSAEEDGQFYTCRTFFDDPPSGLLPEDELPEAYNDEAPIYQHYCNTTVRVQCKFIIITVNLNYDLLKCVHIMLYQSS